MWGCAHIGPDCHLLASAKSKVGVIVKLKAVLMEIGVYIHTALAVFGGLVLSAMGGLYDPSQWVTTLAPLLIAGGVVAYRASRD
jgi:hypothetical protein